MEKRRWIAALKTLPWVLQYELFYIIHREGDMIYINIYSWIVLYYKPLAKRDEGLMKRSGETTVLWQNEKFLDMQEDITLFPLEDTCVCFLQQL